jgi:hypothetical protein
MAKGKEDVLLMDGMKLRFLIAFLGQTALCNDTQSCRVV